MTLLSDAQQLAKHLKTLAANASRLDMSKTLQPGSGKNAVARVYEFYVDLRALVDLTNDWTLELQNYQSVREIRFPHGPAEKTNYPYLSVAQQAGQAECFQICLGIKIANAVGTTFAPDFSVQTAGAPLNPTCAHFVFGWDQKYTVGGRLDRDETAKVASLLRVVAPLASPPTPLPFSDTAAWPNSNAIVTNVDFSTLDDADLGQLGISEVAGCAPNREPKARP